MWTLRWAASLPSSAPGSSIPRRRKLSGQFFKKFGKIVESAQEPEDGKEDKKGLWSRLKSSVGAN